MPITKIPVVHKFGIISSGHRLELQERLLKQTYLNHTPRTKTEVTQRNPIEITEEFVQIFNSKKNFEEKQKYEEKAKKLLERAKRRAGLKKCGQGSHVNLPLAWTEMAQLAQCKGRIQEECLDVLLTSLDVSPLERHHIPALFFLAEIMLYLLRTEELLYPYLRTREIKLLKMGHLVFERLFYHHMTGQLLDYTDSKKRLSTYVDGLEELQEVYDLFPNALLCLKFITEVAKIILADFCPEHRSLESDPLPEAAEQRRDKVNFVPKNICEYHDYGDIKSIHSRAISRSVHDLSPTLWHALDVFRCTNNLSGGLSDALKALGHCGSGLAAETWVDGMIAIQILGESAKTSFAAMKALHRLAQGVRTTDDVVNVPLNSRIIASDACSITSEEVVDVKEEECETSTTSSDSLQNSEESLKDVCEGSEDKSNTKSKGKLTTESVKENFPKMADAMSSDNAEVSQFYHGKVTEVHHHKNSRVKDSSLTSETDQAADQNVTVDLEPEKEQTACSSSVADNWQIPVNWLASTSGITGWHWEVALGYTEILANVVLYGSTAAIQKHALIGNNSDVGNFSQYEHDNWSFVKSAGLMDLALLRKNSETSEEEDQSWRIRYGAMQSLAKICHILKGDTNREGLRTAAWNILLRANAKEKDWRVLEALKVEQMHVDTNRFLDPDLQELPPSVGKFIAAGLSALYLPPLPPPAASPPSIKVSVRNHPVPPESPVSRPAEVRTLRTSIKQEIELATPLQEKVPDYNTRKSFDLRRIIEDQWRKELQTRLEEEEEEKLRILKEEQLNEEERQKQVADRKKEKIKRKSVAPPTSEKTVVDHLGMSQ